MKAFRVIGFAVVVPVILVAYVVALLVVGSVFIFARLNGTFDDDFKPKS